MDYKEKYTFGQQQISPGSDGLVSVRGFLYQTPEGLWVLSQEPNLKSCCSGSKGKVMEQIYLEGHLPINSFQGVLLVSGVFEIDPRHNQKGELIRYYTMKEVSLQATKADLTPLFWIGGIVILSALLFLCWKGVFRKT